MERPCGQCDKCGAHASGLFMVNEWNRSDPVERIERQLARLKGFGVRLDLWREARPVANLHQVRISAAATWHCSADATE